MKKLFFIITALVFILQIQAQNDTTIVYLADIDSTIVQDVKYATKDNFTKQVLYPNDDVLIRKVVGEKLSEAHKYLLENYNLRIKIFDGFRPYSVTKLMWEIYPDDRYVADPAKGSRHNRGAAVDVTLIDEDGNELEMGTGYDAFTVKSHYAYEDLPDSVKANRKLLRDVMDKFGFDPLTSEWWHFDFRGWTRFSILDWDYDK